MNIRARATGQSQQGMHSVLWWSMFCILHVRCVGQGWAQSVCVLMESLRQTDGLQVIGVANAAHQAQQEADGAFNVHVVW